MSNLLIYLALVLSTVFWGGNFNAGKLAVEHMPPFTVAAWRFGLAAICMIIIFLFKEKINWQVIKRNIGLYILLGIIGIFGFNILFFIGLKYTSPVNGALIMATNPLVTVILSAFILKDKINNRQKVGMAISLIGVVAVITKGSLETLETLNFSSGDLIIFAGNVCWALYGVIAKKFLKNSSPLATTTITMIVGAILLIPFATLETHQTPLLDQTLSVWASICFMAFLGSVLAYLWWNQGIARIGASNTAIFFNLVPVFTMVISIITGSPISFVQIIGGIFVISGVVFSTSKIGKSRDTVYGKEQLEGKELKHGNQ